MVPPLDVMRVRRRGGRMVRGRVVIGPQAQGEQAHDDDEGDHERRHHDEGLAATAAPGPIGSAEAAEAAASGPRETVVVALAVRVRMALGLP
jgi:hypothetical protein